MSKLIAPVLVALLLAAGCDSKVRQQQPPRIPDEDPATSDMAEEGPSEIVPEEAPEAPKETAEQKRHRCCTECAKALENDRTGDPPEKIPCADFTAGLSEDCLQLFRATPMTAAEGKACAAEPAPEGAPAAGSETSEATGSDDTQPTP